MKQLINSFFLACLVLAVNSSVLATPAAPGWKAGVARDNITPKQPIWLAGYGGREHPSDGIVHAIWAKALALEDQNGKRAVLITTDLLGVPKPLSDRIRDRVEKQYKLSRADIIINSSHTHTGPVLSDALKDIYPLDQAQEDKIKQYTQELENKLVTLVGKAIAALQPAQLYSKNGVTRFQVNRRNNSEANLALQTELKGPNDYAVPVIKVTDAKGKLMAIAFGYACHPTVLSLYQWSGDYPGFAQIELEKAYPGTVALFFQGAGADQNPLPRRTIPLALQYGKELVAAVERVLEEDMNKLSPVISTAYSEVTLALDKAPDDAELSKMQAGGADYQKRWAKRIQGIRNSGGTLPTSYPYPLQVWKLGEQPVMALGGELVVQYAIDLKNLYGPDIFVMGYSNDVMSYIPSEVILKEGGYEGAMAHLVYGLPAKWTPGIQAAIINGMKDLAEKAGVPQKSK